MFFLNRLACKSVLLILAFVSFPASAELSGSSRLASKVGASVKIDDAAFIRADSINGRPTIVGTTQVAEMRLSVDPNILVVDIRRKHVSGYADQYEHGLIQPKDDSYRYEMSYDRVTGLISFQQIMMKVDGTALDNTTVVTILQSKDAAILDFLDTTIDELPILAAAFSKPNDCSLSERIAIAPIEHLSVALPPQQSLYGRDLSPADGCALTRQKFELAANSIIELIGPLLKRATVSPLASKLTVVAKSGEYKPVNYDIVEQLTTFSLDSRDQSLRVKAKDQVVLTDFDSSHRSNPTGVYHRPLPTVWDSVISLKALRGEKFKAYDRVGASAEAKFN
jgi:hypothetical protein